jgi:ABC-type lipopolysaccharide export system ATPase subunit
VKNAMTKKQKQINMKRTITKLNNKKLADLIDHNVRECIQKKENYEIEYRGKSMILTPEELKTKCVGRQYIAEPKFGDKPYHLLSYLWEPTKISEK